MCVGGGAEGRGGGGGGGEGVGVLVKLYRSVEPLSGSTGYSCVPCGVCPVSVCLCVCVCTCNGVSSGKMKACYHTTQS